MQVREKWGSKLGFILSVAGSAIGLANIWRFPYLVGSHGGAAFVAVYLLSLLLVGFPIFLCEVMIGRQTQSSPGGAFLKLGRSSAWSWGGKLTILTGFLVSAFYSAVAAWVLGYLVEAIKGEVTSFSSTKEAVFHFQTVTGNPWWGIGFHLLFIALSTLLLLLGVRKGIERGNKIFMPLLFVLLIILVIKAVSLPNSLQGIEFLFRPDWSELTPTAILLALGQSFFTLSLGQGTMVTYGSYLGKDESLLPSCFPVVLMDTVVSILAAIAVFAIAFSVGMEPDAGPGLIFHTLPLIFSELQGGYLLAILFFLLVLIAALSSEISAMEPAIAYLMEEWGLKRTPAVLSCAASAFLVGIPCALSTSLMQDMLIFGKTPLDFLSFLASSVLIPVGGFLAVVLVAWVWGVDRAVAQVKQGSELLFQKRPWIASYFRVCFKYIAPILMIMVFLHVLTE